MIAEILEKHEATISRVTKDKYYSYQGKTYPFHSLLSKGDKKGNSISTIHQTIVKMIDSEDKHKPISDDDISKRLKILGIHISRRTVQKYREQLSIPASIH